MIIDSLENAKKYFPLNPLFPSAFAYLASRDAAALSERHEIEGTKLYALVSRAMGKKQNEAKLEVHRKYIDIQYIVAGPDSMGWKPMQRCDKVLAPYSEEKDVAFFADEPLLWCSVPAGSFAIFFPEDAHAPMVSDGKVHKIILKVAV